MAEEEKDEVLDKKAAKAQEKGCTCRSEGTEEADRKRQKS